MKNLLILCVLFSLHGKEKNTSIAISEVITKTVKSEFESNSAKINRNVDIIRTTLYKGTLNGTIKIQLYFNEQKHPCGGNLTILNAMYKYDNQDKWLLLSVSTDQQKKNYCMVEDNFSGVLFLEENENYFNGKWISPDTKKQFEVELEKVTSDKSSIEKLDEILFDELLYAKNDC